MKDTVLQIPCEVNKETECRKRRWRLYIGIAFHSLCLCATFVVTCRGLIAWLNITAEMTENEPYYWDCKRFMPLYFTNWNYSFQAVFLILAFVHDVYEWRDAQESPRAKKIAYWRDVIFQSLVVPYTLFVSAMFWSLYLYDRELVFPKVYDVILPWWFNHCVHTNITIIVLVETVLQSRRHPVSLKLELIMTSVVAVAYAVVYYSIFFFAHRWLYNVFGVLTWWQVIIYQIGIWASSYIFYFIQFPINRLIHSEPALEAEEEIPEKTEEVTKPGADIPKNFEITSMQKDPDAPFSSDNWSLKYRSLREKFENSRL